MLNRLIYLVCILCSVQVYAYNAYSNPELDSLEKDFVNEINQSRQVLRDPLAVDYLNQIGRKLSDAIQARPSTFFIVASSDINAFAGPGGYIGVHIPLILATETEDELAAVMAHELAHVHLHHLYDMIEHEKIMRIPTAASMLAAMALGAINPMLASGAMAAALSGAAQQSINYTRAHEKEADRIGMKMLTKAGFNPHAMARFFNKLHESTRYYDSANIPAILRSHPLDEERIAEAEDRSHNLSSETHADPLNYALFKTYVRYKATTQPKALKEYYAKQDQTKPINRYGLALAELSANQFEQAVQILKSLSTELPHHPFILFPLAQAELGRHQPQIAIESLESLYHSPATQHAAIIPLSEAYLDNNQANQAALVLTKAFRQRPRDILICQRLAEAESKNKRPAYAYFTESQCDYLLGNSKLALARLKVAEKLAQKDPYLLARIEAKKEEIKFFTPGLSER